MASFRDIPILILDQLFVVDFDEGKIFWRHKSKKETFLTLHNGRYWRGTVKKVNVFAHHVIFAMHHKKWAAGEIDHIDGQTQNNSIGNLREASHLDNSRNRKTPKTNKTGISGVSWHCYPKFFQKGKWCARISDGKKRIHIGYFEKFDDAVFARKQAEKEIGYHKNHGRLSHHEGLTYPDSSAGS